MLVTFGQSFDKCVTCSVAGFENVTSDVTHFGEDLSGSAQKLRDGRRERLGKTLVIFALSNWKSPGTATFWRLARAVLQHQNLIGKEFKVHIPLTRGGGDDNIALFTSDLISRALS